MKFTPDKNGWDDDDEVTWAAVQRLSTAVKLLGVSLIGLAIVVFFLVLR